jgi:hypothetical protein
MLHNTQYELRITLDHNVVENTPHRNRTCNLRIKNPVLYQVELAGHKQRQTLYA